MAGVVAHDAAPTRRCLSTTDARVGRVGKGGHGLSLRNGFLGAAGIVVGSSMVRAGIGIAKSVLAASYFGTSGPMDIYLVAILLPDLVGRLSMTGTFNFVPLYAAERTHSPEAAWRAASKMVSYWLALLLCVLCVGAVLAPVLVSLIAPGFEGEQVQRAVATCRVLFLMAASVGAARVLALPLIAERRFFAATTSETLFQAASTGFLVAFHSWGIDALAWGMVFGGFVQLLAVIIGLGEFRPRLRLDVDLRSKVVRRMFRLTLPTYIGNAGARLNTLVNRGFASMLPAGGVSSLQYAYMLTETPVSLLASPLNEALFPFLSSQYANDERKAQANLIRALLAIAMLFAPIAVGTYLLATPLVRCFFERGSFDARSTELTASALQIYAPSILALALSGLLTSAFHARQNTTTPMKVGLIRIGVNAFLCFLLVAPLGHRGIALSNTTAESVKTVLLLVLLWRLLPREEAYLAMRPFLRLLPPLLLMTVVVHLLSVHTLTESGSWILRSTTLAGVVLAGGFTYSAGLALFCREEIGFFWGMVRGGLVGLGSRFGRLASGRVGS